MHCTRLARHHFALCVRQMAFCGPVTRRPMASFRMVIRRMQGVLPMNAGDNSSPEPQASGRPTDGVPRALLDG
jgi:hypothetical protein